MDMLFTKEAWDMLRAYFAAAYQQLGDLELQGYGRVRMEDGEPVCYEVGIPEQEVSMAKTDATWDQMLAFLQERIDFRDMKRAKKEVPTWRLWWHTHGKGTFTPVYSGTDEDTIKSLADEAGDHMWGLVFHSDTMDSCLYLATRDPVPLYATLGKAMCEVGDVEIPEAIEDEVALKISKKEYTVPAFNSRRPGGRQSQLPGTRWGHPENCLCIICDQMRKGEEAEEAGYRDDPDAPIPGYLEGQGGADAE